VLPGVGGVPKRRATRSLLLLTALLHPVVLDCHAVRLGVEVTCALGVD
jgi:hypothetical protein